MQKKLAVLAAFVVLSVVGIADDAAGQTVLCDGRPVTIDMQSGANGTGTPGTDVIRGTARPDVINGAGGNDVICGLGGDDTINGGSGDDIIFGGEGNDRINGDAGKDRIRGQNGNDTINGGDGNDNLNGNNGNDTVNGGAGNDYVAGKDGKDTVTGGPGNDTVNGGGKQDVLRGGPGDDIINGNGFADNIWGGTGNDTINGGDGPDHLRGERGNDTLYGGRGNDTLWGGNGTDTCDGKTGFDTQVNCETVINVGNPTADPYPQCDDVVITPVSTPPDSSVYENTERCPSYNGYLDVVGEVDEWTFQLTEGQRMSIHGWNGAYYTALKVVNPQGAEIRNRDVNEDFVLTASSTGTYRLLVSGTADDAYNFRFVDVTTPQVVNYTRTFDLSACDDVVVRPTTVPVDSGVGLNTSSCPSHSGYLDVVGEVDEWTFQLTEGQRISIHGWNGAYYTALKVVNPQGAEIRNRDVNEDFVLTATSTGTYRLLVSGTADDAYNFRFVDVTTPQVVNYTRTFDLSACDDVVVRPTTVPVDSTVALNTSSCPSHSGYLDVVGEVDEWTFQLTEGQRLSVTGWYGAYYTTLRVVNPQGAEIRNRDVNEDFVLTATSTGTYRLLVSGTADDAYNLRFVDVT